MGRQSRTSLANPVPDFNTVNAADYVLILLYFAILIWVGVYSARRNKNTEDYFRGGGKVPWLIAGMSNWVSGFSAFMFVAAAGFTYTHGAGALLIFTSAFWAYLIGYGFFAARWRRARIHTPLHFLTRRFSASTTYYYSLISIIPQIVGIGQGLYILCIFVSTALGFSDQTFVVAGLTLNGMEASILIVGTVMIVYTVIGGLWAAVLSDAVQSVIIVAMTLIIFVVSFLYLGGGNGFFAGMGRLFRDAPPGYFGLSGELANPWFLFAYFLNVMLGYNVGWALVQRYHSVPDERDAKKMAVLCAVLSLVGPLLWILPVMGSRVIFPDMQALWPSLAVPAEASYVSLALLLLPHGMIGFVVSAILSATLGQANDAFNWLAATLTRDVYVPVRKRYLGSEPTEKQQMRVARGTMLLVGCFGTLVALYIPRLGGAFAFALEFYSLTAAFSMPVALGMLYMRTPWWSGLASCLAAIGTGLTLMGLGLWKEDAMVRNMVGEALAASIVFFGSAFFFKADDPRNAEILQLESDLKKPVLSAGKGFDPSGLHVYRLLGQVSLLLGVVLVLCSGMPSTPIAPGSINGIAGAFLLALAALLLYISRDRKE
jgi:SSS family solute:Na+ symporter